MMFRYGVLVDARVIAALRVHFESACANTAPGGAHAVEIAAPKTPHIRFWTAWDEGALLATGALNWFAPRHAEIRALYVVESMRRRGLGDRMLRHLIADARASGAHQLWLETGSWDYFRPAIEMDLRHGFTETGPFDSYVADPIAMFMKLDLREQGAAPRAWRMPRGFGPYNEFAWPQAWQVFRACMILDLRFSSAATVRRTQRRAAVWFREGALRHVATAVVQYH